MRQRPVERREAARAIAAFLRALGHELEGDLEGTPERVADAFIDELLVGETIDPEARLSEASIEVDSPATGPVSIGGIEVATVCPHHLLPSFGEATVVYLPDRRLAGLGAIAGAAQALSRRLALQESLGQQIADTVRTTLGAKGALCRLDLRHTCLCARGERQGRAVVSTLAFSGCFVSDPEARATALSLLATPEGGPPR